MVFTNLLSESIFSKLLCDTDSCLSFIIIFLDILSVFYLVFCSYYKITKTVRLIGYIWASFLLCSTVTIMFIHTCIFTVMGVMFTIMIEMPILSIAIRYNKLVEGKEEKEVETKKKDVGCYVIFPTNDNKFVFGLHNKRGELLAMSTFKYSNVEETKDAIAFTRTSGDGCEFEDTTQNWTLDTKHPKFVMYLKKQKYYFEFAVNEDLSMLKSDAISESAVSLKMVKEARKCITSNVIYFATSKEDVKVGKKFSLYSQDMTDSSKENEVEEVAVEEKEDSIEEIVGVKTLAESLKEMEKVQSSNVNKQTLFEYLDGNYHEGVVLNRRENYTSTGLPLADTYFTYEEDKSGNKTKKTTCFAYVYEKNGACLILAKLDKSYVKELKKDKKSITSSKFPKTKQNNWFSVIVDDTFTEEEIHDVLEKAKDYCEKTGVK